MGIDESLIGVSTVLKTARICWQICLRHELEDCESIGGKVAVIAGGAGGIGMLRENVR